MAVISNKIIGIDTNIFIYYFQQNEDYGLLTKSIFQILANKKTTGVTSVITLIELLSLPANEQDIEVLKNHFLETPNLTIQEINQTIGIESARIRRKYGFRTPDAIQLAASLYRKVDVFLTNDQRLKIFKEIPITILSETKSFE